MMVTATPPLHMKPSNKWLAYLCLGLSMSLVGSYVALSKPLVNAFPVFLLAWLRFGIGAAAMASWTHKPPDEPVLTAHTRRLLFLESFLGNFLFSVFMLYGVSLTTATAAGVVMASLPAVVALLSWQFLKERPRPQDWAAMVMACAGMALFSLGKPGTTTASTEDLRGLAGIPLPLWGNLLVFLAVVCEASYVVIGKRLTQGLGAKRISAIINLWGLTLVTPMGLWAAWHFDFTGVPLSLWGLLLFYGLAASVWTVWLWMTGLRSVDASQAGVFTVMLPVSATFVGVFFLGERLTTLQTAAFVLALCGVIVATFPSRQVKQATQA